MEFLGPNTSGSDQNDSDESGLESESEYVDIVSGPSERIVCKSDASKDIGENVSKFSIDNILGLRPHKEDSKECVVKCVDSEKDYDGRCADENAFTATGSSGT